MVCKTRSPDLVSGADALRPEPLQQWERVWEEASASQAGPGPLGWRLPCWVGSAPLASSLLTQLARAARRALSGQITELRRNKCIRPQALLQKPEGAGR